MISTALDSTLAGLAQRLGTSVYEIGPNVVTAYAACVKASLQIATFWTSVFATLAIACTVIALRRDPRSGYGEGTFVQCIAGLGWVATLIFSVWLSQCWIDVAAFTASPVGWVTAHLLSK